MKLTKQEIVELRWLGKQRIPLFGGHLERGEPARDPQIIQWVENGIIEAVGTRGYVLTPAARAALTEETGGRE